MWMEQKGYKEYWAMQFPLTGTNDAGYMGLQTVATRPDGSVGQMAIFSLWNASGSRNANGKCAPFDGEGNGLSCRMAFTIRDKVRYRYRVWRLESDSVGQWWGAWIQDTSTGRDYHLGDLRVKSRTIGTPLNFTEYWGEAVSCDRVPESIVNWTQPAANSNGRGSYQYYSRYQAPPSKGSCINHAVVKPMNYGWSQGVRVDSGLAI
jgi:hypothetical protein